MPTPDEEQQAQAIDNYCYSCLYNMLVLFAAPPHYLSTLAGPGFEVPFEMETAFLWAFDEPDFSAVFHSGKVAEAARGELLAFKKEVDDLPGACWQWEAIQTDDGWQPIRSRAEQLLWKLGENRREYDFSFTTVFEG
jgi:hypothetical protein